MTQKNCPWKTFGTEVSRLIDTIPFLDRGSVQYSSTES